MKRIIRYDVIRCVAIFLVICIHSMGLVNEAVENGCTEARIINAISGFIYCGVPLFVMLSGALLLRKEESTRVFFRKRLNRILVPFLFWSMIVAAILYYQDGGRSLIDFFRYLLKGLATSGVHGTYWYVYMIIGLYFLTPILRAIVRAGEKMLLYFCVLCLTIVVFGTVFPSATLFSHWLCENLKMLFFYMCGYLLVTGIDKFKSFSFKKLFLILFPTLYFINSLATYVGLEFPLLSLALSVSLFGFLLTVPLAIHSESAQNAIQRLSRYSYGIYLSHIMLISAIVKTGVPYHLPLYIEPLLMAVVVLAAEMAIFFIADKLHLGEYVF